MQTGSSNSEPFLIPGSCGGGGAARWAAGPHAPLTLAAVEQFGFAAKRRIQTIICCQADDAKDVIIMLRGRKMISTSPWVRLSPWQGGSSFLEFSVGLWANKI